VSERSFKRLLSVLGWFKITGGDTTMTRCPRVFNGQLPDLNISSDAQYHVSMWLEDAHSSCYEMDSSMI
jgi:hypothetical protein